VCPQDGGMAELAEGARLLSECRGKTLPRVRIPLPPPVKREGMNKEKEKIMPIYEYKCPKCGVTVELFKNINDDTLPICDDCGVEMNKLISNTTFILRGSGWYKTDYANVKDNKTSKGIKNE
jgi:putative FmdB family regulatory protein